ncbi:hypothetical protein ONS95_014034 [Cadophora gregata]|uniref:uncharacterized protein n=1 Tax=Cadophora gregata TaxID=51156 RepID=UPI0026DA933A|nr:uncharacterized protein ONS95_014034 [Cadophora gregata]KAK0113784.1 hypothetical protein ONS96_014639 [Cadophora gregata f. sp. sojae]KAK0114544.1 hypothetical protein ONS95_014034 [Cadophora gregata]
MNPRGPPQIPPRISSLIPAQKRKALDKYTERKASSSSKLSTATTTIEFIDAKNEELNTGIEEGVQTMALLQEAFKSRVITIDDYQSAAEELKRHRSLIDDELRVVKRQKRALAQDIEQEMPTYGILSEAYSSAMSSKVMAATANMKVEMVLDEEKGKLVKKKFDKKTFKTRVMDWYGATKNDDEAGRQSYCVVSGWQAAENVSAAHLVPKSLNSQELLYLFDVQDDKILGDCRNGIPMHNKLENALDNGKIVFVPIDMASEGTIMRYKLVLTDKSLSNKEVLGPQPFGKIGVKWSEIDGKELNFLNEHRPAQRFLFFRFVTTLFHCKEEGLSLEWLKDIATQTKNKLWCTPGPYLRQSMLKVMAIECGLGIDPVSEMILSNTFTSDNEISTAEVAKNATALRVNVKDRLLGKFEDEATVGPE